MIQKKIVQAFFLICCGVVMSAQADTVSDSGSMTGAEATMTPRFFRDGTGGAACSEFSGGNFQYQSIDLTSDSTGTLTASFDPGSCSTGIFVTFHSNSFNPANICTNHLWSFGSSQAFSGQSFPVPPNTPIRMIVSGVSNAPGVVCGPFSYTVAGVVAATRTLAENIAAAIAAINGLAVPDIIGVAQKNSLLNSLNLAAKYQDGTYKHLSLSLVNSVLVRVDGCALRGTPDTVLTHGGAGMDFVTTCPSQGPIYSALKQAQTQLSPPLVN